MSSQRLITQNESASNALVRHSLVLAGAVGILGIFFAALAGIFGLWLFNADIAKWAIGLVVLGVALAVAWLLFNAWDNARWVLVGAISADIEKQEAEADRVRAEVEIMRKSGIVQNVSAKGHARVIVNNAPSVNQQQEIIRLVPVHTANKLIDGVAEADLAAFIDGIFIRGHSQRAWMGQRLPSGKTISTFAEYDELIQPLLTAKIIVDRSERKAGQLTVTDPSEAKEILGLPAKSQIVTPD